MSQPTSNCQYYYTGDRCGEKIIFASPLYMMPLGSRSPIYFNLSNCRGEHNLGDRIRPLFYHRFLELASWKTDGCWRCVGNILLKQAIRALGQTAGGAIDHI
ncbi:MULTISPECIES: hypothetical protein [unclassified Microcoleus]|uniref:hypothetical protein n=1 Tax=unclassified Microcoleus TaxID=2642155 RepID=UPI002FD3DC73